MMSNSPWDQGHHPGAPAPGGTVYYQDPNLQGHEAPSESSELDTSLVQEEKLIL